MFWIPKNPQFSCHRFSPRFRAPGGHLFAFYTLSSRGATGDGGDALQALRGTGGCPSRARRLRYTDDARRYQGHHGGGISIFQIYLWYSKRICKTNCKWGAKPGTSGDACWDVQFCTNSSFFGSPQCQTDIRQNTQYNMNVYIYAFTFIHVYRHM